MKTLPGDTERRMSVVQTSRCNPSPDGVDPATFIVIGRRICKLIPYN